jgi:hypothetical protein
MMAKSRCGSNDKILGISLSVLGMIEGTAMFIFTLFFIYNKKNKVKI